MGIGNGTRGSHLQTETVLQMQLEEANSTIRKLSAAFAAVLVAHHGGKVLVESPTMDAMFGDEEATNGYLVKVETLHGLGQHRVTVLAPDGSPYRQALQEPVVIDQVPPCSEQWHRDGTGIRCPKCGKTDRIV